MRDHPRACGVYLCSQKALLFRHGSSPRVRGLPRELGAWKCEGGIIPARAGFTVYLSLVGVCWGDHPRACGVYGAVGAFDGLGLGSSPRVRGLLNDGS